MQRQIKNVCAILIIYWLALTAFGCASSHTPVIPDVPQSSQTCPGLGAAQGVTVFHGKIYVYGDANPGVVREYVLVCDPQPALRFTGRVVFLTRDGVNLLNHPTGLALHDGMPTFLGNTITRTKEGRIFRLDFARALTDGNIDHAVLDDTLDDLAVQGCRPEYVRYRGRFLIATSDYGRGPNFVRFYDPQLLSTAARTSQAGVEVRRVPCGPWVQSLQWIDAAKTLVMIQNVSAGRRWRLTLVTNLDAPDYRTPGPGVKVLDIPGHTDELEGYGEIDKRLGVFITSSRRNNITFATVPPGR